MLRGHLAAVTSGLIVFLAPAIGLADWTSIGPFGGPVTAGAASPSNPAVIYASPQGYPVPVLRSTDSGEHWVLGGSLGNNAYGMAVDPANPDVVYGACGSFYRSTDGGTTWGYISMPSGSYVRAAVVNPQNSQTIYTTGYAYDGSNLLLAVHKTTDGGTTWDTTGLDTMYYSMGYALAMDPADTSVVYCAGYSGQYSTVFKTTDAGATWQRLPVASGGYYIYALHVSPADHNIVIAGTYFAGIYRSTDAGATWTQAAPINNVNALAAVPGSPQTIYAAGDSSVYVSGDTGHTWTQCAGHATGYNQGVLAVSSAISLVAGTKAGMFRSVDAGATWQDKTGDVAYAEVPVIAIAPSDLRMMYAEYRNDAVYKTTDAGVSWQRCPEFLSCGGICGFALNPSLPDVVWALEGSG
jgi:photosystem II stability/assembly factor-like uncharacterized protein